MYLGDFKEDGDVFFKFTTRAFATGIPFVLANTPVLSVFIDENTTGKTTAESYFDLDVSLGSIVGYNNVRIDLSGDAFFATGGDYSVVITTGTVDSVSVVGEVVATFSIENRSMGQPAGATLAADIAALVATVGVAGAGLGDLGGMATAMIAEVKAAVADYMTDIHLDHLLAVDAADVVVDDSAIAQLAATAGDWSDFAKATDSLQSIRDHATTIKTDTSTTIDLVNGLGGSTGGSVSIETLLDNTLTGVSINNGGAAVDKGTSPATVGIPVTGHAFVADQQVTLANTASNDGSFDVDSVSTNEVVILKTFAAETFGADDTISSTVKTVGFIGSVQSGTVVSTEALDGTLHDIDDVGDDVDLVYTFSVGAGRTGTEIIFHGFAQGNSDTIDIEVYDHVGTAWEILRTITGQNGTFNITLEVPLLLKHTGTTGLDTGRVYVRFDTNATTPSNLSVDQLLVEAINTGALSAYENGQIWVNTNVSNTNTVADVDGTSRRPVSTIAAAKTLSTSTGLSDFHVINGSSITLAENTDNESYFGDNWTLALGGQSCAGAHFQGAFVSGVQTGASASFHGGEMANATLADDMHAESVGLKGTITLPAGTVQLEKCHNTGTVDPVLDYGDAVGSTIVHVKGYDGHIEVQNMGDSGTDELHLTGDGELVVNANCVGGTIDLQGAWAVTDGSGGAVTITYDDTTTEVTAVKVVTDTQARSSATIVDGAAETGTLSTTEMTTGLTISVAGQYNERIIIFASDTTTAALRGQATDITATTILNGKLGFTALTTAPANGDTFAIV